MSDLFPGEFYMGRHGETNHNAAGIVSGDDAVLTEIGRRQAVELKALLTKRFDSLDKCYFVVSDLLRAKDTQQIATDGVRAEIDPRLNERCSGVLGGRAPARRIEAIKAELLQRARHKLPRYKGVQDYVDHRDKVLAAVHEHRKICPEGRVPVFISHYGTIQRVCEALGCVPLHFNNAGLYHFKTNPATGEWTVSEITLDNEIVVARPIAYSRADGGQGVYL